MNAVQWRSRALRELNSLDRVVARRVLAALERYAETGHGDVIRLRTQEGGHDSVLAIGASCSKIFRMARSEFSGCCTAAKPTAREK